MRHTPFRAASVTPRRHTACWGARDRTALTKPCGNERGATDRREERGSVTDGQNAATTEKQPDSVRERESKRDITAVKRACACECVRARHAAWNREKGVKDGDQGGVGRVVCHTSVLGCDVCFASTFCPVFNTTQQFLLLQILPKSEGSVSNL